LLIEALNKYQGSIILVSHDRYFISKTANKIWEIVDHKVKEFKGGYEEWVAWNERMAKQKSEAGGRELNESKKSNKSDKSNKSTELSKSSISKESIHTPNSKPQTPNPQTSAPINKELKKELQKQQKIFQQLEVQIGKLSEQKIALEASLIDPAVYSDKNKFLQAEASYKNLSTELENLNIQYEKTFELIVSLEAGANG